MGFFMGCFGKRTPSSRPKTNDRVCPKAISTDNEEPSQAMVKKYTWEEIERFTMNFKEVIGVGGYSTVYLAKFPDITLGAVKKYNCSERLNQVFKSELEISQKLHHANIVKLLGYCDDKDEGVLVFEYIPKGNLQEKLHNEEPNLKDKLTWKQRMTIAYQLAKSLEYLHESCDLQIVHGDIKASNILLDESLNALLCDFGFAKMGFSSMIKPSSSRISMMGSPGYIDPHFLMTGITSKMSDVYSFGVILLELITGLEAFICSGERQVLLTSLVREKDNNFDIEKLVKMIDPWISRNEAVDTEEVKGVGVIAARCLHHLPGLRLSSSEICQMMQKTLSFLPDILVTSEKS